METDLALVKKQAKYVGLEVLSENWEVILKEGARKHLSFFSLLSGIIEKEYNNKMEKGRQARIQRARIPEKLVLETFPFSKQPRLDRKTVYQIYDSLKSGLDFYRSDRLWQDRAGYQFFTACDRLWLPWVVCRFQFAAYAASAGKGRQQRTKTYAKTSSL